MLDHVIAHQFYSDSVPAKLLFTHPPTLRVASFRGVPSIAPPPPLDLALLFPANNKGY